MTFMCKCLVCVEHRVAVMIDEHVLICHCCLTSTDFLITCSLSPGTYHRQDRQLVTVAVTCFVKSLTAIAMLNKLVVG